MNGVQLNADDDRTAMLRALENRKRLVREQEEREVAERQVRLVAADITHLQRIQWQHSHQRIKVPKRDGQSPTEHLESSRAAYRCAISNMAAVVSTTSGRHQDEEIDRLMETIAEDLAASRPATIVFYYDSKYGDFWPR